MPDLIRHPDIVPTKVGDHFKEWIPVFTGNPGFRLEFIPMKIWAGMTILTEGIIYKQTRMNYPSFLPLPRGREERSWGQHSFYLIQALFQLFTLGTKLQRFFLHLLNNLRRSFGKKLLV